MHDSAEILLLDDQADISRLESGDRTFYRAVICLFWLAPGTQKCLLGEKDTSCYGLRDIVSSEMDWGRAAYKLAGQIVGQGPLYRGLPWRMYLTEALYREFSRIELLIRAVEFVENRRKAWKVPKVVIHGTLDRETSSLFVGLLSKYPALCYQAGNLSGRVRGSSGSSFSRMGRLFKRFQSARLTGDWRTQAMDLWEGVDRSYRLRMCVGSRMRAPAIAKGGITFFSSYLNNSRILSSFAGITPCPVHWVLTNHSAHQGIPKGAGNYSWVWRFGRAASSMPKATEGEMDLPSQEGFVSLPLAKSWLESGPAWRNWKAIELPLLAKLTHCWESYLDEAKPGLIVVANQWSIEGWFARIARNRGIPVLQVMHGAMGGYLYTQTPIQSNAMVVPGDFWRSLWPDSERQKFITFNSDGWVAKVRKSRPSSKKRLIFFSWPLASTPFFNFSELTDCLVRVFHNLLGKANMEIVVRPHPRENPSEFLHRWKRLFGPLPREITITNQNPLPEVLGETDLALMFCSTVLLHCLANEIPVVMPGWIDCGWNEALRGLPGIYLAPDFSDLERQIGEWLANPPSLPQNGAEYFVRPPGRGREAFISFLRQLNSSLVVN